MEIVHKVVEAEVKKLNDLTYEFTASTEEVDRDGEVIEAAGWDLRNFKKNPVITYAHDYRALPIGKAPKIWVSEGKLKNHVEFPPIGTYEFADVVRRLVEGGFLRSESVGFKPYPDGIVEEDGDGIKKPRRRYTKQELLEIAIVPVPSNPNALIEAKMKGIINEAELKLISKPEETEDFIHIRVRDPADFQDGSFRTIDIDKGKGIQAVIGRLKGETTTTVQKYMFAKSKGWTMSEAIQWVKEHGKEVNLLEVKGAIPYKRTPLDESGEWDAGKEVRNVEVDDLKIMCAIVEGDPENKTSYKLPHHRAGGEHTCVWRGVAASAAVLMGARGGVDAPPASIAGAKTHIGKHYADFDKGEPPWEKGMSQAEIKDELDFIKTTIAKAGLNEEAKVEAWALVLEVMRFCGDDIPLDIQAKIGAVLNQKNKKKLHEIQELCQQILDSAEHEEEPKAKVPLVDTMEAAKAAVRLILGKIS